jgi:hypothetical protein
MKCRNASARTASADIIVNHLTKAAMPLRARPPPQIDIADKLLHIGHVTVNMIFLFSFKGSS